MDEYKIVAEAVRPYLPIDCNADSIANEVIRNLASAGFVIAELDTPYAIDADGTHYFSDHSKSGTVNASPGDGVIYHDGWEWTSQQAWQVARQWLSAASTAARGRST